MKKLFALLLALAMVLSMAACAPSENQPTTGNKPTTPNTPAVDYNTLLAGDYGEITLWVSETKLADGNSVVDVTKAQIEAFQKLYPNIKFTFKVDGISEGDAASQVLNDVASAPDIYCFAQDQLARLVQAQALIELADSVGAAIKAENDPTSVTAASVAGKVYAYPLTADNGYYLYYDKSVFTEEDVKDLATMVQVAETKGGKIRFALENAWYTASFFFATGCHSNWTMNAEGKWTGVDDDFNSDAGLIAMKGMQILAKSSAYDPDNNVFTDAVAIVTGTWGSKDAANHFGENMAATKLPSFNVDGKDYQLGSYFGCKLMGVKPQSGENAANKTVVLQLLAQHLTNKENQLERYQTFGWGPANLEALADEAVKNDTSLKALFEQKEFAIQQGNINGSWWDIAKLLGSDAKNSTTDDELRANLKTYEDAIKAILTKTDDELKAWGVIGSICGTNWDTDFPMTEQADGSFLSDVLALTAGNEFKVRQGGSWDVNYGEGGALNGANIVVAADGNYQVKLTLGDAPSVELIPVN